MRVSNIEVVERGGACQVQALVASDFKQRQAQWFEPFTLWYRFPAAWRPFLSAENGDPFLAALLVGAMRNEERLAIDAQLTPRLLAALPEIQAIYAAFDAKAKPIPVETVPREASLPVGDAEPKVGLFFSLGVDSTYSLLKNEREHPTDERSISHLLPVHGIDAPFQAWDEAFPPALLRNCERVAAETGKTLIPVVTNVRRDTGAFAPWTISHGGGLVAVALALGTALRRVHIAASTTYDRLYPWGSHPVLDRLWSTDHLDVVHDGCEMVTIDKTRFILAARPELVLDTLRPCGGYGPGYNCGACIKCMRTMLDLLQFGYLHQSATLPHEIDVARLRVVLRPGGPVHVAEFTRRLHALEAQGLAPEVQAVLREHLAQGMAAKWTAPAKSTLPDAETARRSIEHKRKAHRARQP